MYDAEFSKTKLYHINKQFAISTGLPIVFAARELATTQKAAYLYGYGTIEAQTKFNTCAKCGSILSHPGSILLGIGPVCAANWGLREEAIKNMSGEQINEIIGKVMAEKKVDRWIPKSMIKRTCDSNEQIVIPKDHKMLRRSNNQKRTAIQINNNPIIKVTFSFNYEDISRIKNLSGHKFHSNPSEKFWTCALTLDNVEKLQAWGFELDDKLNNYLKRIRCSINSLTSTNIPGLKSELYPFQKQGVAFIEAKNGRALIADEMGLGKTIQALAWLQLHPEKRPAIVVCPASLKLNWAKETHKWLQNPNTQILSGTNPDTTPLADSIIILNYDILPAWLDQLRNLKPQVLIIDEIHYIKSNSAQRTRATKALAKTIPHIIGLSGTPIINRPIEAFNALKMIDTTVVPDFWTYARKFCGARHTPWGWDLSGASNQNELHQLLTNTIMIRRLKKDVLADLPPKIRAFVPIELSNKPEYYRVEEDFINWVYENQGLQAANRARHAEALVKIEILKQTAIRGKLDGVINWIQDFLDVSGKLVVFTMHKFTTEAILKQFNKNAVKVDGSVTGINRDKAVELFQTDDNTRLLIGNIKAAGLGLTLTAASNAAFVELPWTPGEIVQAEDRVHRITQQKQTTIYYLLASGTIEERMAKLIDRKQKILNSVLDGEETEMKSLLSELFESYTTEK